MSIEVIDPGALTTVQDPVGRRRWRRLGVPVGGAADAWSARLANRLVGNPDGAAVLEMTLVGATLAFHDAGVVAVTGGLRAVLDGLPLPSDAARRVRPGSRLVVRDGPGARGYLAVAGGLVVPSVLGSPSTELRTGFGGLDGRALRAGDRLEVGARPGRPHRWASRADGEHGLLRVLPGIDPEMSQIAGRTFTVGPEADRIGVRCAESVGGGGERPSVGLPLGAVQLPPDGRPIVMLADRPVTGGYLVPAVVIAADIGRAAQLRPGDPLRFVIVDETEAREARRHAEAALDQIEPLDGMQDDDAGWAGAGG